MEQRTTVEMPEGETACLPRIKNIITQREKPDAVVRREQLDAVLDGVHTNHVFLRERKRSILVRRRNDYKQHLNRALATLKRKVIHRLHHGRFVDGAEIYQLFREPRFRPQFQSRSLHMVHGRSMLLLNGRVSCASLYFRNSWAERLL